MNSNYRIQNFSDAYIYRRLSGGLYRTASRGQVGWVADLISGVFHFFISMGAFTVRIFLRWKMGSRSFGLASIILGYLWLRLFLIHAYVLEQGCENFYHLELGVECNVNNYISFYLAPFLDLFEFLGKNSDFNMINDNLAAYLSPKNCPKGFGYSVHLLSLLVIIFGVLHLITVLILDIRKVKWHSFHRGNCKPTTNPLLLEARQAPTFAFGLNLITWLSVSSFEEIIRAAC